MGVETFDDGRGVRTMSADSMKSEAGTTGRAGERDEAASTRSRGARLDVKRRPPVLRGDSGASMGRPMLSSAGGGVEVFIRSRNLIFQVCAAAIA